MPRIRTIKPEFWGDEKLSPLPAVDRLVFLGLISMADDLGRVIDSVRSIDGYVFPATTESCAGSLDQLALLERIKRGKTASGQSIIQIVNWKKHQKIDKPNFAASLPPITWSRRRVDDDSTNDRRQIDDVSTPHTNDQRPTIYDHRAESFDETSSNGGATESVLAHYLATHPRRRIGPKDRKAVAKALTLGYSAEDLCAAIDGNAADPWHREKHKHELPYVLRDNGKIDDFRGRADESAAAIVDPETGLFTERGMAIARGGR